MKRATILLGVILVSAAALAAGMQNTPAAIVAKLSGTAEVQREGGGSEQAAVGTRLFVGDRIVPAEEASLTLLKKSGETETVGEGVVIAGAEEGEEGGVFTKTVRVLAQASSSSARSQPNRQGMIRPIPGTPVQVAPRNGLTVLDPRPTFVWLEVPEATGYRIQIRRVDGGAPIRYEVEGDTTWTLPEDAPALIPGATYRWTIGPVGSGRAAREQAFRVAGPETYATVAETLSQLAASGLDPAADGLFLAGLAYRDAGLYYEAERALEAAAGDGSALGREYYLVLGEVYDAMGMLDAASRAFDRADAGAP